MSFGSPVLPSPIITTIELIDSIATSLPLLPSLSFDDNDNLVFGHDAHPRQRTASPDSFLPRKRARNRVPSDLTIFQSPLTSEAFSVEESNGIAQEVQNEQLADLSLWTIGLFDPPTPPIICDPPSPPTELYVEFSSTENADFDAESPSSSTPPESLQFSPRSVIIGLDSADLNLTEEECLVQKAIILMSNPALLRLFMLYLNSPFGLQPLRSIRYNAYNIVKNTKMMGDPTYNLPDEHPIFANIPRLKPFRYWEKASRIVELLTVHRTEQPDNIFGIHTEPLSTASLGPATGIHSSIPSYPLLRVDSKGEVIRIDNKAYYKGRYSSAFDLACHKIHIHMLTENGMPEIFDSVDALFWMFVDLMFRCLADAFEELSFVSYKDKVFRFVHEYGFVLGMWDSRIVFRNFINLATRSALLTVLEFTVTPSVQRVKELRDEHEAKCKGTSFAMLTNRNFVKPFGNFCTTICDYTNELFFHALMRALFLDDSKIGRLFRSLFINGMPIPVIAYFATSMHNSFDEFVVSGALSGIDFSPEPYFQEYQYHIWRLTELMADEIYGPILRDTIRKWIAVGCSLNHSGGKTVKKLKVDLVKLEMREASGLPAPTTYSGVFSSKAPYT